MKKRGLLILVTIFFIATGGFAQNAKQYLKAGEKFMEAKNYEAAIEQYARAIDVAPNESDGYLARAQAYEKLNKFEEALSDLEKGLILAPKDVQILVELGRVNNSLGKYQEALPYLNRAADIDKKEKEIYPVKVETFLKLNKFDQALKSSDTALLLNDNSMNHYDRGKVYLVLTNDASAKTEFEKSIKKDKENPLPRIALVDLLIKEGKNVEALKEANEVIALDDRNVDAYSARSRVYIANTDFPSAINDISKNIVLQPDVPSHYLTRGTYYQQFNQHSNAINDFTKYISLKGDNPDVYYARATSYEDMQNYDKAIADYLVITELAEFDPLARKRLKEANDRMYEINREAVAPVVSVISPVPADEVIEVRGDVSKILVSGRITDKSKLKSLKINNEEVPTTVKNGVYDFVSEVNIAGINSVVVSATDDYDNSKTVNYTLRRTEINKPEISLIAPYTSESLQVYLESTASTVAIQGKITDESIIENIYVGKTFASADYTTLNPTFSANLEVSNINKFTVTVEDIYGNKTEVEYTLNREGAEIAANNPMGKTWVVFVENSSYESFAALDGPKNDINTIRQALANYQINNIIHLKDMKKSEMEKYFNIELRDLVKANQVKSIMVWYAGHGKSINDIGYWIPVDAKRDDEFTYFNVNQLKAGLQGYTNIVHTLVVSDACETGAGFYTAMRGGDVPTCDNTMVAGAKSAQVFSSANAELATDNSKFTSTFANTLMNNTNACIPIDVIATKVTEAVFTETGQKPKFGKIVGLEDMNGTFFFIAK